MMMRTMTHLVWWLDDVEEMEVLMIKRESQKYNINESSDNLQSAYTNALWLAYMREELFKANWRVVSPIFKCMYSPNSSQMECISGFLTRPNECLLR
jgi:hypothetical protein